MTAIAQRPSVRAPSEAGEYNLSSPRWVAALRDVPGVDAAFISPGERVVYVVAREHKSVDWEQLLEVEDVLQAELADFHLTLRAHQCRDLAALFPGLDPVPLR